MHATEMSVDIVEISKAAKGNFLKLAKLLRKLHDMIHDGDDPEPQATFEIIMKKARISRRKAYYLIEVERVFGKFDIPYKRLSSIGWTKLAVMTRHVTEKNLNDLLDLADACTVEELKAEFSTEGGEPATRFLTFRLGESQYASVLGALLAFGAKIAKSGRLGGKEAALVKLCGVSLTAKQF